MKTSVVMNRDMGNYKIHQRTKDGMFNATSLAKQYNKENKSKRNVADFLRLDKTKEFINALELEMNDMGKHISISKGGKDIKKQGTWMSPLLFIDFAMWLNPTFKVKVLKFVYDELIKNRHNAGDNYLTLSSSGAKLKGYNYAEVATALNWIVFGKKGKELRQSATQEQLCELNELQTKLSFAIDMGYIKDYKALMGELRKIWQNKYNPIKISA